MMSPNPNPNDRSDNFFDSEEIAEFLGNVEESVNQTSSDDSFDEWADLLNDDFLTEHRNFSQLPENRPERMTFSDLPSDDEISEIFSENFSWSEEKLVRKEGGEWQEPSELEIETSKDATASPEDEFATLLSLNPFNGNTAEQQATPGATSLEDELASFFGEESFDNNATGQLPMSAASLEDELETYFSEESFDFSETISEKTNPALQTGDWDELKQLLTGNETEEAYAPSQFWQSTNPWGTGGISPSTSEAITEQSKEQDEFALLSDLIGGENAVSPAGDAFDDLASFLEETPAIPATPQPETPPNESDFFFDELEAVLEAPTTRFAPATSQKLQPINNFDREFGDLEQLLEQVDGGINAAPVAQSAIGQRLQPRSRTPKTKLFDQTMRVPVKQLDNLSNLIGELVVKRNALEDDEERMRQSLDNLLNQVQGLSEMGARMHDLYERTLLEGALLASRSQTQTRSFAGTSEEINNAPEVSSSDGNYQLDRELDALEMDRFTGFHLLSQEMIELIVRIRESTSDIQFLVDDTDQVTRTLRQVTTQLQEGMTKSRMIPFAQTADRLPRAILEVSRKLHKQAKLHVEGKDVLIDKMILEQLYNPMTHLVNNAIAHGIETPEERLKNGKTPEGKVTVRAFIQGNQTVITVSDDGAGINPEKVKFKAIEKGLITQAQARSLSKQEVYDFLFHPGFSTKDQADDFAGRGVGLDVVYTNLSEIRGTVSIDSAIGKGTTFTIRLPLTLSICKALCCESERSRIAFPIDGIEDTKDYLPSDIYTNEEGQKCVRWRDLDLPIYTLNDLLTYHRQSIRRNVYTNKPQEEFVSIVFLRSAGNLLALQVDRVFGEQEIVIKQIEGPIPKPAGIAGATVLGDGSVMPIGDVLELIEIAQGRMRTDNSSSLWKKTYVPLQMEAEGVRTEPTVLIVDDSITVRQLLSLSFGKAGYRVEQARDGQEALDKLQSGLPCDIVFCDIEMPRMNGLELLSHLQQSEILAEIPVALLTSRGAQRHRTVAAKLGASGYFTKPYTEKDLLDAAARMLKGEVLLPGSSKVSKGIALEEVESAPEPVNVSFIPTTTLQPIKTNNLVLIVDDSVMVREMLSMTFNKSGYQVEQARDGQEAWEKLRSGLPCDLILCDIEMPRMNGLELLSRLQEDEQLSTIPMAMITSRGAQKMQNFAAEKGAKGYFVKPYIEEVLLDAAKRLLAGEVLLKKGNVAEE